ncbi:MAG: Lrp/AsnC family transcriptional regulator [Candidatus Bathyarchaeota archaeon]|nr:Lrp/AsnC family transcriptional regulator [Candidatus Bathyarchaeota archaeon]
MLDEIDRAIIDELLKDSRTPFTTIAKRLNISPGTVKNRFEQMKKDEVIVACSADVNLAKFGYQCKVFLMLKISRKEDKLDIIEKISKLPNVIATQGIMGEFDIFALAVAKDIRHLDKVLKDIRATGIEQMEISLSIRDTIPLLPDKP